MKKLLLLTILLCSSLLCQAQKERIVLGDEQTSEYFPILKGKRIAIFSNHTGMVGDKHLLDILLENKFNVVAIFSPEHGFRGDADAGEHVSSSVDKKTGVPILSLYDGKDKKPSEASMRKFDILVIDIQDVGLRFYTYYITMCRLMDACAEYNRKVLLLDRPNPNGHYVDGPILDMKYKSGVGWLPIPIVHGMTLGELALMVNGERWLPASRVCDLTVIPCKNYTHQTKYTLPIPPSPNLPNDQSIRLYPSLCFFEGTNISVGRGTYYPFQILGAPDARYGDFTFTPTSLPGFDTKPLHKDKECYGTDLREYPFTGGLTLKFLLDFYNKAGNDQAFFFTRPQWFDLLAGTKELRFQIVRGLKEDEIRASWQPALNKYKKIRKKYLLYPDYR